MATNIFDDYVQKISPLNQREGRLECMSDLFLDSFKNAPEYTPVRLYMDDSADYNLYDAWIYSESAYKQIVADKTLLFPPSMKANANKVFRGQYVRPDKWDSLYLITAKDSQYVEKIKCKITKCTQTLRFYNNGGKLLEIPCVIKDKLVSTDLDVDVSSIITNRGDAFVIAPSNEDTRLLKINDRLIFNGQPFKIASINDFINNSSYTPNLPTIMYLDLYIDPKADGDDLVNNIPAYNNVFTISTNVITINQSVGYTSQIIATVKENGVVVTRPLTWTSSNTSIATVDNNGNVNLLSNGTCTIKVSMTDNPSKFVDIAVTVQAVPTNVTEIRISPNVTELLQGQSQTYTAYKFVNGIQVVQSLTFSASGVPTTNYDLTTVDGNHFTVKNKKMSSANLVVTATDGVNSSSISVKLKGSW